MSAAHCENCGAAHDGAALCRYCRSLTPYAADGAGGAGGERATGDEKRALLASVLLARSWIDDRTEAGILREMREPGGMVRLEAGTSIQYANHYQIGRPTRLGGPR